MQKTAVSETTKPAKTRTPAIQKATEILDFIATTGHGCGVSELARALLLPKSSVHGICETLADVGLLRSTETRYELGPRSLRWSSAFLQQSTLVSDFEQLLSTDNRLADFSVTLSSMTGGEVIYLACRNSNKPLGITFQAGMRLPAIFSATGKAMLAFMDTDTRAEFLAEHWSKGFTSNSVASAEALEAQCEEWHQRGYALDRGEIREGMICLGVPIMDQAGQPAAGLAISMTAAEASEEALNRYGEIMREIASRLIYR